MMAFQIKGMAALAKRLEATTRDQVIKTSLTKGAFYLQNWIQNKRLTGPRPQYLGVISGRLRSSVAVLAAQKVWQDYVAKIGTNVVYAATHEFGRGRIPKRPFMRPALEDRANQSFVLKLLSDNIKRAIRKMIRGVDFIGDTSFYCKQIYTFCEGLPVLWQFLFIERSL